MTTFLDKNNEKQHITSDILASPAPLTTPLIPDSGIDQLQKSEVTSQ